MKKLVTVYKTAHVNCYINPILLVPLFVAYAILCMIIFFVFFFPLLIFFSSSFFGEIYWYIVLPTPIFALIIMYFSKVFDVLFKTLKAEKATFKYTRFITVLQALIVIIWVFALIVYFVQVYTNNGAYDNMEVTVEYTNFFGKETLGAILFIPDIKSIIDAFYFSTITLATLGYGDITPLLPISKMLSAIEVIIGFSIIASALSKSSSEEAAISIDYRSKKKRYLLFYSLDDIPQSVQEYYFRKTWAISFKYKLLIFLILGLVISTVIKSAY